MGEVDARLGTVADWMEPDREGVVCNLIASRVRGVLLWNIWEQVETARRLIAEPGQFPLEGAETGTGSRNGDAARINN